MRFLKKEKKSLKICLIFIESVQVEKSSEVDRSRIVPAATIKQVGSRTHTTTVFDSVIYNFLHKCMKEMANQQNEPAQLRVSRKRNYDLSSDEKGDTIQLSTSAGAAVAVASSEFNRLVVDAVPAALDSALLPTVSFGDEYNFVMDEKTGSNKSLQLYTHPPAYL